MYAEYLFIEKNKTYSNKTKGYVQPMLAYYGSTLQSYYFDVNRVAVGINDLIALKCNTFYENSIFILMEVNGYLQTFLNWCRMQFYYQYDYVYDTILKGKYHMLVLSLPEQCSRAYNLFLEGKYSKMFSEQEIEMLFKIPEKKLILKKSPLYKSTFYKEIQKNFGEVDVPMDVEWEEYDFPPSKNQEFFNFHLNTVF